MIRFGDDLVTDVNSLIVILKNGNKGRSKPIKTNKKHKINVA